MGALHDRGAARDAGRLMRMLRVVWFRLQTLFHRSVVDTELDLELRDHVERETRANVGSGMAPTEARRAALVAFGGVQQYKEQTREARGLHWLDVLQQDVTYAWRHLRKAPAFTGVAVISL